MFEVSKLRTLKLRYSKFPNFELLNCDIRSFRTSNSKTVMFEVSELRTHKIFS